MAKVEMLRGDTTPEVFCAKLLENAKDIKAIACVVLFKDENGEGAHTNVFNTVMTNEETAWMRWVFDQDFRPD